MDIIIAGEQGAGKSTAAALLLKALRKEDALEIVELAEHPAQITGLMYFHRARAVLFDGCIATPSDMVKAVTAVKHYRTQINADVLAIYVAHGSAVMLSDGTGIKRNTFRKPEFPEAAESALQGDRLSRTDMILANLWDTLAAKVDEEGGAEMFAELRRLTPDVAKDQAPGLHHLTKEGRIELHTFLLKLLRRYE